MSREWGNLFLVKCEMAWFFHVNGNFITLEAVNRDLPKQFSVK